MRRALLWGAGVVLVLLAGAGGALAWVTARYRPAGDGEAPARVAAESARLRAARDSLAAELRARVDASPILGTRPSGDVLIGIPTTLVSGLARDVSTQYFHDVDLTLRRLRVHKAGDVRAKVKLLGRRRIGSYDLSVTIDSVRGRLRPGEPRLGFSDGRIRVRVPVHLASGGGRATVRLTWDSHGLASPVCGDLALTRVVTGTVRPARYEVRGLVDLTALEGAIVADPDFPELAVRIFVVPSERSLATLDSALHLKGRLCDMAVDRIGVRGLVLGLVDRGFDVKIPQRFFRPIHLPIAVSATIPIPGRATPLHVQPSGLRVSDRMVWLGADVRVGDRATQAIAAGEVATDAPRTGVRPSRLRVRRASRVAPPAPSAAARGPTPR